MGERNKFTQAIILTVREQGENNRTVCALSRDYGIIYATLYGGPKSKLKSLVQPFNSGTLFIYDDENRHTRKISDFDVKNFHTSLKENLFKTWAANLACEIMLKTKCAGDDQSAFILLSAFIDGIDAEDENGARIGTIRFLWRYLSLLGIQPDVTECIGCARNFLDMKSGSGAFFIQALNGFVCNDCKEAYVHSKSTGGLFYSMTPEAMKYLDAINCLTPGQVRRMTLQAESLDDLKRLTYHLIESAVDSPLLSIQSGHGIL